MDQDDEAEYECENGSSSLLLPPLLLRVNNHRTTYDVLLRR